MDDNHPVLRTLRAGEPLRMPDMDFIDLVLQCRDRVAAFNATRPSDALQRLELLRTIVGRLGADSWVEQGLSVDFGLLLEIGTHSFVNMNCTFLDTYPISIGDHVQIGPNCVFSTASHPVPFRERKIHDPQTDAITGDWTIGKPIVIEDGVWIGASVTVTPGVTIGARSVIGAGSVVTRSIPPDVLAYGNPCRVARQIN